MSLIQIGLVDMTGKINADLMQSVAAALNVQVSRDLPQFWPIQATVRYLPDATKVPVGVWPVQLVKQLPPGEGGFHTNKHNQPFAKVIASPDSDEWTIDASHETLEMLVDPDSPPTLNHLGSPAGLGLSLRQWVDGHTHEAATQKRRSNTALIKHCKERRQKLEEFARARVKYYPLHAAGE
jgi:hypothetical protein